MAGETDQEVELQSIAVITDIHGNLPALEACLETIAALGIEEVLCGGDLVGYGPHPNQVCELIQARGIPTTYGNYDYAIGCDLEDVARQVAAAGLPGEYAEKLIAAA